MQSRERFFGLLAVFSLGAASYAATFGTEVPVRGTVSDIALDEVRRVLYIADLSAWRIDVMNIADRSFATPMLVFKPPSAVALSPDSRFLVVGHYDNFPESSAKGGYTIFDLYAGVKQEVAIGNPVLSVAFGAGNKALVVTTGEFLLLNPLTARTQTLGVAALEGKPLPVPFATFPPDITQASTGVSGDRQTIVILAESATGAETVLQYRVGDTQVKVLNFTASPPLGPRAVSVNRDGSSFVAGWVLFDPQGVIRAQFPYPLGKFRNGGHAFDFSRNVIYADIPVSATEAPVLHVVDTDNLTVRERIQLPQMMSGRSLFSSDMNTLYAASDEGVMVLSIGSLGTAPRVAALQEDIVFQGDACNRSVVSQTVDIVDLGGGNTDFALSLPANTAGIRLSATSGTTPAKVRIDVDPTVYQNVKGTTTVTLSIQSSRAVNIPFSVRLLINTRDFNQRGRILNVPGKIVDLLADRVRSRIYLIRQDRNLVLVYDTSTFSQVAALRTGNTPVGMAITDDQRYLIVGNDNSQLASVFDLETLQPVGPILFPGAYPRSFAVAHGAIWATVRAVATQAVQGLYRVDFAARVANAPPSLGIYINEVPPTAVLPASPSENYVLLAMPDGTVAEWDATVDQWVVSRKDFTALSGAYGVLTDNLFLVDNNLLNQSLSPVVKLQSGTGSSSGVGLAGGAGLRTTTASAAGPGTIERIDLANLQSFHGTPTIEAPVLATTLQTAPVGQIGQTILPFTRTLAVPPDQSSIILLTQSGITVLAPDFDAPTPVPSVTSVTNSADGGLGVAPGGLVLISGKGLAPTSAAAGGLPLPSALGDACVTLNNVALPLFRVSSTQIMAQLPFTVRGDAPLVVRAAGGISGPFTVHILDTAPAIFRSGTAGPLTGLATVLRDFNNDFVTVSNPIHPGDTLMIFLTGMGVTTPLPALGDGAPIDPLATTVARAAVTLGNTSLGVGFSGLVPGEVGVYQINATVPRNVASGMQVPLVVSQGTSSTTLVVRVLNP